MRKRSLHTKWFEQGSSLSEREDTERMVKAAQPTLSLLAKILRKELVELERTFDYDSPAWQYKLAHQNGRREKINELLDLLDPVTGE